MDALRQAIDHAIAAKRDRIVVDENGGCNFHYAGPNRTNQPRRAFAVIYIPNYVNFTGGKDAGGGPWDHPLHPTL